MSVAPFEFVPLTLTVEPDVSDDLKCQDQISGRLFYGRWSLRKVSRYARQVNSLLSLPGIYLFQGHLKENLILLNEDCGINKICS